MKRIIPMFDRVLVKRLKPKAVVGGIIIPEVASEKSNEAIVVAVGKGLRNAEGMIF